MLSKTYITKKTLYYSSNIYFENIEVRNLAQEDGNLFLLTFFIKLVKRLSNRFFFGIKIFIIRLYLGIKTNI